VPWIGRHRDRLLTRRPRRSLFRQTKVKNLRASFAREHDIVRLQIAMHDAGGVCGSQTLGDLHSHFDSLACPEFCSAQRFAIHQLSDQIVLPDVVDGHDVGMIQRRHGPRFLLETMAARRIARNFVGKHLQRNVASQAGVARFVHFAHATSADGCEDFIRAQRGSGS
jgi:hypothetical protein